MLFILDDKNFIKQIQHPTNIGVYLSVKTVNDSFDLYEVVTKTNYIIRKELSHKS